MKKILCIFVCVISMMSFCSICFASEEESVTNYNFYGAKPIEELNPDLLNRDLYDSSLLEYDLTGKKAIPIYCETHEDQSDMNIKEIIAKEPNPEGYWIIGGELLCVFQRIDSKSGEKRYVLISKYDEIPNCLQEYIEITTNNSDLISATIFDFLLTAFFYEYEKEIIVLYYPTKDSASTEFSFEDYQKYKSDWYAYLYKNNYDENGSLLYGGTFVPFLDFVNKYDYYISEMNAKEENDNNITTIVVISSIVLVVIASGIIYIVAIKAKKKTTNNNVDF